MPKEQEQQNQIMRRLRAQGRRAQRINSWSAFATRGKQKYKIKLADKGTPDIIACVNGNFVGIEVKASHQEIKRRHRTIANYKETDYITDSNDREVHQRKQSQAIREAGGFYILTCSPSDLKITFQKFGFYSSTS